MTSGTSYLSPNGCNMIAGDGPPDRLVAATLKGVVTLERNGSGGAWDIAARSLEDRHVGSMVFEPVSGKLFVGAHADGGMWVSDDGAGESWRPLEQGIDRPHIYALTARTRGDAVTLFAGTSPAGLYRSDDLGERWFEIASIHDVPDTDKWTFPPPPHSPHVKDIVIDPGNAETIYVLVEQGALLKSTNDGESWTELASYSDPDEIAYRDVHRLLVSSNNTRLMYLASGEGLYRSLDGGASWDHLMRRGDRIGYPDFLFFDPAEDATIYMGGSYRNPGYWYEAGMAESAILRSTDGGDAWQEMKIGLPDPVVGAFEAMSLYHWPGGMLISVGTATGQIYASEDCGGVWTLIAGDVTPISKDDHHLPFLTGEALERARGSRNL
ncbi:MAG: glycosyl hydrolase [Pseudomonadota bacterium]|nr:glycosyl hydrolase [Pseudomonadota bacterium]